MRYFEIITEAKTVLDARHLESDLKHFGGKYHYIDPSVGFFFNYDAGVLGLYSEENMFHSEKVGKSRGIDFKKSHGIDFNFLWNKLGGLVKLDSKTVTISKESYANAKWRQRDIPDLKSFQKALKELKRYGVTDDFIVKGIPKQKRVGDILSSPDPTDAVFRGEPITMFHGTSLKRWEIIQRQGLRPGNTGEIYQDLHPGYSENNIYLAVTEKGAIFYGKRQAIKDNDVGFVVLSVSVPDPAKILADDRFHHMGADSAKALANSGRTLGEFAYCGNILPKHIKLRSSTKL